MPQTPVSAASTIRPAEVADVPAINEIYNEEVLNSTATFDTEPGTAEEREGWLNERRHPHAVVVAEHDDEVVGWASFKAYSSKPAYRFSVENAVYVRADMRGNGIGALLLARLLEIATENGFRTIIARITTGNPASEQLHRRFGFRRVGVEWEVGYKFDRWQDVVVMQKLLVG
jgi:L-amino acid N-acyltransferase YncA